MPARSTCALLALPGTLALAGCAAHPSERSGPLRPAVTAGRSAKDSLGAHQVFAHGERTEPSRRGRATPDGALLLAGTTGAGVTVYVIDSGIRRTHRAFAPGRAQVGGDFVREGRDGEDCHGHGTHVAGVIGGRGYGVAPGARLVALRIADCRGTVRDAALLAALAWIAESPGVRAPAVLNYSLSSAVAWTEPDVVRQLEDAVRRIVANGVTVVVAAGNRPPDACRRVPSRLDEVLTVDATESGAASVAEPAVQVRPSEFGRCVDLIVLGARAPSAWWTNDTAVQVAAGTSVAAAVVSGAAALYLECHPAASPAAVAEALRAYFPPARAVGSGPVPVSRLPSRATVAWDELRAPCPPAPPSPAPPPT